MFNRLYKTAATPIILAAIVVMAYGGLYAIALTTLHQNGFGTEKLIFGEPAGDSYEYVALAQTMLSDGRFAMSATSEPETFRTPGYPVLVATVLVATHSLAFIPIVQIVLAALSCVLIYLIGAYFFSYAIGLGAAILFAIDPSVPTNAFISASDILFVFLMLCSVYVLLIPKRTASTLFTGGVLLGAMTLVRPLGLYVIPLVALWLLWELRRDWRFALRSLGLFLAGAALILLPWVARNYAVSHHAIVASVGSYNLLFYAKEFEHQRTGKSKEEISAEVFKRLDATPDSRISEAPYADKDSALAWEYISAHPVKYAIFHMYSMLPFYLGSSIDTMQRAVYLRGLRTGELPPDINISGLIRTGDFRVAASALLSDLPVLLERVVWLVLCVAALAATLFVLCRRTPVASISILFFGLILEFGGMTGPVSYSRYRLPAEPFIFILGCAGLVLLLGLLRTLLGKRS